MAGKIGVLLINLGTPDATSYWPMRSFLKEFLSDPRVIEAKGLVWWLVFNTIILTKRPKTSGQAYKKIWNEARNESPLKTITRSQAEMVAAQFSNEPEVRVEWAMRYGNPSITVKIIALTNDGCDRILLFPLYPQYSAATTASVMDEAFDALKSMRHQPTIRAVPPYFAHPAYIEAIADSIRDHHASQNWKPEVTVVSFHGLPQAFIDKGDPYQKHCEKTFVLLREALGIPNEQLLLSYQSRSGRAVWIGPDTEDALCNFARHGVKNVAVVTPGFAADCVETLEEIRIVSLGCKNSAEKSPVRNCIVNGRCALI